MKCKRCNNELEFIPNYTFEDIETNEERITDVYSCVCGTLHYKENGCDVYEFGVTLDKYQYVKQVTDYDVSKSKIKESEHV